MTDPNAPRRQARAHALRGLLAAVFISALAGCTSTRPFDADGTAAAATEVRMEVNERAQRADATVTLASGERVSARSLHVAPDVTTWLDPHSGAARSAPTAEVFRVRFTRRGRGALEGAGIGLVLGVVTGAALGYATGEDCPENQTWDDLLCSLSESEFMAVAFGLTGGALGTVLGGITGGFTGNRLVYVQPVGE